MPPPPAIRANALKQLLSRSIAARERPVSLRPITRPLPQPPPFNKPRAFTTTSPLLKKKSRADREAQEAASASATPALDPFDFSDLQKSIEKALEKLKNDLGKLRTGGRFNPEVLEGVRVCLGKDKKGTERLGDLAQVLPKGGRMLSVLVGEKEHVHPIMSAIQASKDLNLQPQSDPQNVSQLNIPIPPPTKESRDQALAAASKTGETAKTAVHAARSTQQKRLRGIELKREARPDDLKKAHKEMEKIVEKGVQDVKKAVEAARKTMEQV